MHALVRVSTVAPSVSPSRNACASLIRADKSSQSPRDVLAGKTAPVAKYFCSRRARRLSAVANGEGRLEQTMAPCRAADELAEAGIRLREGSLDARRMRSRVAALRYGKALVALAEAHRSARCP